MRNDSVFLTFPKGCNEIIYKCKLNILEYISACLNDFSERGGGGRPPQQPLRARPCRDMPAIRTHYFELVKGQRKATKAELGKRKKYTTKWNNNDGLCDEQNGDVYTHTHTWVRGEGCTCMPQCYVWGCFTSERADSVIICWSPRPDQAPGDVIIERRREGRDARAKKSRGRPARNGSRI